jgi:hypothetical protein
MHEAFGIGRIGRGCGVCELGLCGMYMYPCELKQERGIWDLDFADSYDVMIPAKCV